MVDPARSRRGDDGDDARGVENRAPDSDPEIRCDAVIAKDRTGSPSAVIV